MFLGEHGRLGPKFASKRLNLPVNTNALCSDVGVREGQGRGNPPHSCLRVGCVTPRRPAKCGCLGLATPCNWSVNQRLLPNRKAYCLPAKALPVNTNGAPEPNEPGITQVGLPALMVTKKVR